MKPKNHISTYTLPQKTKYEEYYVHMCFSDIFFFNIKLSVFQRKFDYVFIQLI